MSGCGSPAPRLPMITGRIGYSVDILTDVTEQNQISGLERKMQEALMSHLSFGELGDYLCQQVKLIAPDIIPSIVLVDAARKLRPWGASMLPAEYSAAIDGLEIGEAVGACGTAAHRGELVLCNDIEHDPLWASFVHLALPHDLRACWSYPIKARDGHVIGTFAFYSLKPRAPDEFRLRIIEACVYLCALAIEREDNRQRISRLVQFDSLTGLPNRTALYRHVDTLLKNGQKNDLSVFCLDIDRFKDVNETLGHAVGDQVLVLIGNRLGCHLLPDEYLARESDQFVIASTGVNETRAAARAAQLQEAMAEPLEIAGHVLSLSASIGISHYPDSGTTCDELLVNARAASSRGRNSGGNTIQFFSRKMNEIVRDRLLLGTALKRAIATGGLSLKYQPQINSDGTLYGVEALARWHDADFGDVPPGRFIELAEEIGQIEAIGRWALREGCRQMAEWRAGGVAVPVVSINLSPLNLRNADLPDYIAGLLREFALSGTALTVEVTESGVVAVTPEILEIVNRIRALGVGLSVDDFGTGFSSLANLANLPVTEIKIDRSFVDKCLDEPRHGLLVDAVIGLGRSLGLHVVAEGVETEAQRRFLTRAGNPALQGYLFSAAMAPQSLAEWLSAYSRGGGGGSPRNARHHAG